MKISSQHRPKSRVIQQSQTPRAKEPVTKSDRVTLEQGINLVKEGAVGLLAPIAAGALVGAITASHPFLALTANTVAGGLIGGGLGAILADHLGQKSGESFNERKETSKLGFAFGALAGAGLAVYPTLSFLMSSASPDLLAVQATAGAVLGLVGLATAVATGR